MTDGGGAPDWRTGKICSLELPAPDPAASAEFYRRVFGWAIRRRGDGELSFTDTVGEVSGVFDGDRALAWFADPVGNVLGVYQQPGLAETEVRRR